MQSDLVLNYLLGLRYYVLIINRNKYMNLVFYKFSTNFKLLVIFFLVVVVVLFLSVYKQ